VNQTIKRKKLKIIIIIKTKKVKKENLQCLKYKRMD